MSYGQPYNQPYAQGAYQQPPYGTPGQYMSAYPPQHQQQQQHARRPSTNPAYSGQYQYNQPAGRDAYGRTGGRGYQSGAPPPVGADPQLWQWFTAVDVDQSGAISAQELRQALLNGDWSNFDLDTVKMLMTLFDVDRSGTITFDEFAGLWKYIRDWQNVFRHFDADRSGSIDGRELKNALEQFGYRLTPRILRLLEVKYADLLRPTNSTSTSHPPPANAASLPRGESRVNLLPGMTFDRFVRACVVVKHLTDAFQRMDEDRDGWVQMNYETFMSVVLTAP